MQGQRVGGEHRVGCVEDVPGVGVVVGGRVGEVGLLRVGGISSQLSNISLSLSVTRSNFLNLMYVYHTTPCSLDLEHDNPNLHLADEVKMLLICYL